ncbi:probable RNA methyltransferase At5g51130 isoform X3 [Macadamia integrifolia]|uniref:probable RNA methyltransferase At5g51130 isoform X3 n=1 Tax=Macadamia integrifolia TaxID=60698 RepID=UPI001C4ED5CB|nr:probable RNA methyltransferase At5g51130 isoform X3 [Macadamia integrifolia]
MKAEEERNPGDMEAEEEEEVMEEDNNEKVNETQTKTKKRKRKAIAIFGNYRNYYGYRTRDLEEDPRLMLLKKEWFEGKDCLDIGCNQGLITISIAKKFFCQSICGIDIDSHLVESAYWNLRRIAKMDKEPKLFDVVSFRKENFVSSWHNCSEAYDTILCLSVTKWVHLNWGDDGLITLFAKIWRLLRPGGILLLEAQNWKSYKSNYRVSEIATFNFHNILLPPSVFQDILLDKIGFRTVENITASLPGGTGGFNRPIFVFCK